MSQSTCAVPGCTRAPVGAWGLHLCLEHLFCPRCGTPIHAHGRNTLWCCDLAIEVANRQAWKIPWHVWLAMAGQVVAWPHKISFARVLVGRACARSHLPVPVEVAP